MSDFRLNVATCPVNWNNNDLPGWRELVPFPEVLDCMLEAGYRATEYDEMFGTVPDNVLAETKARKIKLCGSYQWLDLLHPAVLEAQITNLRARLQLLRELECDHVIIADMLRTERVAIAGNVPADGSASLAEEGIRQIAASAGRVAQIASEYGIIAHYHNHVGTWIEAPDEVSSLLPHLQEAGIDLCFDTGHYAYGGGDSAAFLSDHIRDIGYLHLKDVDGAMVQKARSRGLSFLDALRHYVFTPLGTGTANIAGILATLVERQFPGWIVIEQDTCTGDNTMTARQNLAFFRQETEKRIQA